MPRLAIIGDVHGALDKLELVLPQVYNAHPDGILMVGDLGSEGDLEGTAMGVLDRVSQLERPILFVPGNHDIPGFPYEWSDDMLRHRPRERADILLAHCPPLGATVDRTTQGKQAGSQAMRELLTEGRFELMVCGHIHEAPYAELVEGVPCVNAGALGAPFGAPQFVLVDWEPEHIGVRHIVLPYILQPETLPWLRGAEWGPDPGERHWRFERRA
jgi:Icc-related predicted phosphoesterase